MSDFKWTNQCAAAAKKARDKLIRQFSFFMQQADVHTLVQGHSKTSLEILRNPGLPFPKTIPLALNRCSV